jgi:hypothetical protein
LEHCNCLCFVWRALWVCCSNCDFIVHPIFLSHTWQITTSPSVVKASSIATHSFNFDAREEATGPASLCCLCRILGKCQKEVTRELPILQPLHILSFVHLKCTYLFHLTIHLLFI